jgi:hypothetical protein
VETSNLKGNSEPDKDIEIGILATAKKMGLSFEELNLFSLNDYLVFVDKWTGKESDGYRQATQADIDFFMG